MSGLRGLGGVIWGGGRWLVERWITGSRLDVVGERSRRCTMVLMGIGRTRVYYMHCKRLG